MGTGVFKQADFDVTESVQVFEIDVIIFKVQNYKTPVVFEAMSDERRVCPESVTELAGFICNNDQCFWAVLIYLSEISMMAKIRLKPI